MDPSQLLGSSALSTGDPALDAILQSQFRSSGPAAGSGFSPGSMAGNSSLDPILKSPLRSSGPAAGSGFSPGSMAGDVYGTAINGVPGGATAPTSGPAPTGTSVAKYVPPLTGEVEGPASKLLRLGGRLGAGSLGASVFAAPALQGPNAFGGDVNKQMAAAKASDDADRNQFWQFWQHPLGYTNPLATQNAPPTTSSAPASVATDPPTLTRTQDQRYPPVPPTTNSYPPGPPGPPGPFVRGPIPAGMPQMTAHPSQRGAPNLGYGVPQAPPFDPGAIHPSNMFTTIDRPNADTAGGPSFAGQLAPQYFNRAREPGGPAQMGALDLSGMFNHPAVAQAAAAHPMVQAAARAPVQGPLSALAPTARAPVVQQQWSLPQVRKGGAAMIRPTYGNPATGGSTVGIGN